MLANLRVRIAGFCLILALGLSSQPVLPDVPKHSGFALPAAETFSYHVEWRLIHAGNAKLEWNRSELPERKGWDVSLALQSVGMVSKLFKVNDHYSSVIDDQLCVQSSLLKVDEGKKHREVTVDFDAARKKASYQERDLNKDAVVATREIEIPGCVHDVIGALYQLRTMRLDVGQSTQIPISDGKKFVMAKVEAQQRETVKIDGAPYKTVRYEAFLFDNILYRRKGRLFIWLTDDERRIPVQIRIRLPFYIGTVTLQLEKEGNT